MRRSGLNARAQVVLTGILFALAGPLTGLSATNVYYVSEGGGGTPPYASWTDAATDIQTAIIEAEGDVGGGTECIVLVTNGTYTLTNEIAISAAITVRSVNGRDVTFIDGGYPASTNRCVNMTGSGAVLDGFTVSNGYFAAALNGAGIYCTDGTVRDCTITRNQISSAGGNGIGVYANGATITNCIVTRNTCPSANTGRGGGLYTAGGTLVLDCVVSSNTAKYGAGLYAGSSTIRDCEISYNYAHAGGQGAGGQGLYSTLENCLIIGNESSGYYGGWECVRNTDVVRNCTIVGNKANNAALNSGGLYLHPSYTPAAVNTVVWGNQAAGLDSDLGGYTNNVSYSCAPELAAGVDGNTTSDPQFTDWDATDGYGNGHTRGNYTVKLISPCVDTGTATGAPDHDFAHDLRPLDGDGVGGAQYDMGCYEAPDASAGPLTCGFSTTPSEGAAPLEVAFDASVSGNTNGIGYQWVFGDGTTNDWSSFDIVTNTYASPGVYGAVLNVTNAGGGSASKTNVVTVYATTVYVAPGGGHVSPFDSWVKAATNIQDAVNVAGEGYSTVLVSNGTYRLSSEIVIDKAITVESVNGRDVTILDGGGPALTNRCVSVTPILGATLRGFTIRNGIATNFGGGVYCAYGTVTDCTVSFNRAITTGGSGVYLGLGGKLLDSTVSFNSSPSAGVVPYGGGVYFTGDAVNPCMISNCVVASNTNRNQGGGIYGAYGEIRDCRIEGNRVTYTGSSATGGGLYITTGVTMENCAIVSNYTGSAGGGVDLRGYAVMRNCLVAGNESRIYGGGVVVSYNSSTRQRVQNCTIVGNAAGAGDTGGGVYVATANSRATNCIVFNNLASGLQDDIAGAYTNFSFSCSPDLTAGVDGNITGDPLFEDAGSGYGLAHVAGDYHLSLGSPCADSGTATGAPDRDLDGNARPEDGNGDSTAEYDMGVYEAPDAASGPLSAGFSGTPRVGAAPLEVAFSATVGGNTNGLLYAWDFGDGQTVAWTAGGAGVTNTYAPGTFDVTLVVSNATGQMATNVEAGFVTVYAPTVHVATAGAHVSPFDTWAKAATNIQAAIDAAGEGYSSVLVSNGTYRLTAQVSLTKGITVQSLNGRDVTFVDGGYPQVTNRCFYVGAAIAPVLQGFTITNGCAYGTGGNGYGGGVYASNAVLKDCAVSYNRADRTDGECLGGGVYAAAGSLIRDCTVSHNLAVPNGRGDGIAADYSSVSNCIVANNGTAGSYRCGGVYLTNVGEVRDSLITANQAKYAAGFHMASAGSEMFNCEVSYNRVNQAGGSDGAAGILWYGQGRQLLVYGNEAMGGPGGVHVLRSSALLESSTVVGNSGSTAGGVFIGVGSVLNSVIFGNQAGGVDSDVAGTLTLCSFTCAPELTQGVDGNITSDPNLASPGSGYGLAHVAGDYMLKDRSPCVDKGSNQAWMVGATDLAGEFRIQPAGGTVNMGAYEKVWVTPGTLFLVR